MNELAAQERIFKFFNTRDGLPTNNIFKVRFDRKGFLWIAHDKGISRFDGNTFKNYAHPNQKSNVYTDVYIAPDGRIWMTNLGQQAFFIENDEMKLFRSFDLKYPPATLKIGFLPNGHLIFNANGGILETDSIGRDVYHLIYDAPIQSFFNKDENVYFNLPRSNKLVHYRNQKAEIYGVSNIYPPIFVEDSIMFSTFNVSDKLNILNIKTGRQIGAFNLGHTYSYSEIRNGKLLVYTYGNMQEIQVKGETVSSRILASGHRYTHFTTDVLGNEWYATLNEGIMFVPRGNTQKLGNGSAEEFNKVEQFGRHAYALSNGNQLYRLDKYKSEKLANLNAAIDQKPAILVKNLNNRSLLLGNSKFVVLDTQLRVRPYFPLLAMKDICMDNQNMVYMATSGSVYFHKFDPRTIDFMARSPDIIGSNQLKSFPLFGRYTCIAYDTVYKQLFAGGVPGLFVSPDNKTFTEIKDGVNSIYPSVLYLKGKHMIAGTIHTGIYVLSGGKIRSHYHAGNSSLGNTIIKIIGYGEHIWILSDKGLHNLNPDTEQIQTFSYIGAVNLNNCTDFTIADNQLYLISGQELFSVNLQEFIKSLAAIPVYFSSVRTGTREIFKPGHILLSHFENTLAVELEIPAASVLGNVEFEYNLNGDGNWLELNRGQRTINLSQLLTGSYSLHVRQKGLKQGYILKFDISPPFWETWWFFASLLVLISLFVYAFYSIRINNIRRMSQSEIEKFKLEKALQQNILSSIKSQMNPHFIFNALNTIQSYIYLNDKKQAIAYLGKFSELTRKILEQSNFETITLTEEHETLDLYLQLEKMRFENLLDYRISFKGIAFKDHISIPPMLIQPYVENAVKHGLMHKPDNRFIDIMFRYSEQNKMLHVSIDDNGIGRKRSGEINRKMQKHRSFSTQANRTRLDILNKDKKNPISLNIIDKTDDFGNPTGTCVQINIPVS